MKANWPDLPAKGFTAGRPATKGDVAKGAAVFSMDGKSRGALRIAIPQYALWRDQMGNQHPVILIQAEEAPNGMNIVGFRDLGGHDTAGTLPELTLLGVKKPN